MNPRLDVEMAAAHAGVSVHTIWRWIRNMHLIPVARRPTMVLADDVSRVHEQMRANHRASLLQKSGACK